MKIAFLYAGQGAQRVGMGVDFYEAYPTYRAVADEAASLLDFDPMKLCADGPAELLAQTSYTQPIMATFAVGVTELLRENGITPSMTAGLSLGEYCALYSAGALTFQQLLPLLAFRGKAMETACDGLDCGMAAILGMEREPLAEICRSIEGTVSIANYNCKGQLVIGGEKSAVDKACDLAKQNGAKRCMPLNVSGAFHTELMKPAADALCNYFKTLSFNQPSTAVYHNTTAKPLKEGESLADILTKQVMSSVYMQDCIENMVQDGAECFIEIGPGKVLGGFVKKTVPSIPCHSVDNIDDLKTVIELYSH